MNHSSGSTNKQMSDQEKAKMKLDHMVESIGDEDPALASAIVRTSDAMHAAKLMLATELQGTPSISDAVKVAELILQQTELFMSHDHSDDDDDDDDDENDALLSPEKEAEDKD